MSRRVNRVFRLNDEIAALVQRAAQAGEELAVLRHLDDDARRDAAVGDAFDRADARRTAADVARMEAQVARIQSEIRKLESKRDRLLDGLPDT